MYGRYGSQCRGLRTQDSRSKRYAPSAGLLNLLRFIKRESALRTDEQYDAFRRNGSQTPFQCLLVFILVEEYQRVSRFMLCRKKIR